MSKPDHRDRQAALAYLRGLHESHMKECDIADECGGSYMRGDHFPLEVPLWVVRALAESESQSDTDK